MATKIAVKAAKNICILAIKQGISLDDYKQIIARFEGAEFTLIAPNFDFANLPENARPELWTDGARSGFLKVLTISRRMSWSSFDLVINWEQGGIENALCFMLLPKPRIITKQVILYEIGV